MSENLPAAMLPASPALPALGARIRARRKALGVTATAAAEAAHISRVTLHRIERGEPAVAMGAWLAVLTVLGLQLAAHEPASESAKPVPAGWLPARISPDDYPQLRQLAWQVRGDLKPLEAWSIYERNARHIDAQAIGADERRLIDALRQAFADSAS